MSSSPTDTLVDVTMPQMGVSVAEGTIVAWRVEDRECDDLARDMFTTAFTAYGTRPRVVHSDGGPSMTSKTLAVLFRDLSIDTSRNRPRVSNDNPYSESLFKTAKYTPGYPPYFTSLEHARGWAGTFVTWYNTEHRHSALAGYTPASMHDGSWTQQAAARQQAMHAHYRAHPRRYRQEPTVLTPPARATINLANDGSRLKLPPTIHTLISH